jgi:flagellar FliL protein
MRLFVLLLSLLFIPAFAVAEEEGGAEESGIQYLEMKPKFTVNLSEPKKYLMIQVQLLVEGGEAIAKIKKHMPALRHELIMLYSGRQSDELQTMEQREALRKETVVVIHKTLDRLEKHSDGFKDAFFTDFLVD